MTSPRYCRWISTTTQQCTPIKVVLDWERILGAIHGKLLRLQVFFLHFHEFSKHISSCQMRIIGVKRLHSGRCSAFFILQSAGFRVRFSHLDGKLQLGFKSLIFGRTREGGLCEQEEVYWTWERHEEKRFKVRKRFDNFKQFPPGHRY